MNVHSRSSNQRYLAKAGFTLLEIVIALGMMSLLVGMVFRVASSSIQLGQSVVDTQQETMERNAFFRLLTNTFEQIPGNAVLRLETYDSSGGSISRQLFDLTLQNIPMAFNWGESPVTAEAVQISTVQQSNGFINVVLKLYDVKILEDAGDVESADEDAEPFAEITLLEDLWLCDCDVVDPNSELEAFSEWDNDGQLPLQVKFYCRFDTTSDIVQQTCWIVPKVNTAVYFRELANGSQRAAAGNPEPADGGQRPTIGVNVGQ